MRLNFIKILLSPREGITRVINCENSAVYEQEIKGFLLQKSMLFWKDISTIALQNISEQSNTESSPATEKLIYVDRNQKVISASRVEDSTGK